MQAASSMTTTLLLRPSNDLVWLARLWKTFSSYSMMDLDASTFTSRASGRSMLVIMRLAAVQQSLAWSMVVATVCSCAASSAVISSYRHMAPTSVVLAFFLGTSRMTVSKRRLYGSSFDRHAYISDTRYFCHGSRSIVFHVPSSRLKRLCPSGYGSDSMKSMTRSAHSWSYVHGKAFFFWFFQSSSDRLHALTTCLQAAILPSTTSFAYAW